MPNFGFQQGWPETYPRYLADLKVKGRADIVGFGADGVYVSFNNGDRTFADPRKVVSNFGFQQGWQSENTPRYLADLTGDGLADIVGFGVDGVWVSFNNGDGTFSAPKLIMSNFGFQQGWQGKSYPRFLSAMRVKGRADIVGFGVDGVWVSFNNGDKTFSAPKLVVSNFGFQQGWQDENTPRYLADLTGSGLANIVGFGIAGVWIQ